jgi:hypothetical protein
MGIGETSFVPNTAYGFNPVPKEWSRQNQTIDDALDTQTDGRNPRTGQIENRGSVLSRMFDTGDPTPREQGVIDPEAVAAPEQGTTGMHVDVTVGEEETP